MTFLPRELPEIGRLFRNFDFFPRKSRKIGRFFREFAPENPAKFCFFFREISEALTEVSNKARNIGVIFDSHVNLEKHVMNTCKTAFYHLRNIVKIRNYLSQDNAETLVHAFISSKLDFCNALLYGLPQSVIDKLQYVQNCTARLVTRTRSSEHITPVLRRLHWLYQSDNELRTKYYFLCTRH